MNNGRSPARRNGRATEPHVRIPDAFYDQVLPELSPYAVKLWLALKCREWRKDGRGRVRKSSLRQVAREIRMPLTTTQRAFEELAKKGLAERASGGVIRVISPDFTMPFTTGFTTYETPNDHPKKVGHMPQNDPPRVTPRPWEGHFRPWEGHLHLLSLPNKGVNPWEIRIGSGTRGAKHRRARTVDTESRKPTPKPDENRARLTPGGDGARSHKTEEECMTNPEDKAAFREARDRLLRQWAREEEQERENRRREREEREKRERQRCEELRAQAKKLLAEEEGTNRDG